MDLIERDTLLAALQGRLQGVSVSGHVMLVAGEAGVGKSSLLREAARRHADAGGAVWWGACDALDTPVPLAPLLDIAREAAPRLAARLDGPRPALFEAALDELRLTPGPLLVVVEDAHWADDATLDLLRYLGRRIERTHALLAVSYRDDEVTPTHPLRRVLGELPPAQRSYLPVPRLSAAAVEALARRAGRRAEGLHALTQGNAFFVTEWLRDGTVAGQVPPSVQDVVLARCARLPAGAQAVLRLVAVVPGRTERWLLDEVLQATDADLDAALGSGLLVPQDQHLAYRHELGRVAVESALSVVQAQALHRQLLQALQPPERGTPAARLVHHALRARDVAAVGRWAPLAADEAVARGSHREARAHWHAALQHGRPADEAEHRRWLEGLTAAGIYTGRTQEDLAALQQLEAMALARGDLGHAAWQRSRRSQMHHQLLQHGEAERLSTEALALVEGLEPSTDVVQVYNVEGYRRMLERDVQSALQLLEHAQALAEAVGDPNLLRAVRAHRSVTRLFVDFPTAAQECLALAEEYRAVGRLAGVSTMLSNLGSGAGELMHLALAETCLRDGLALCRAHEIDNVGYLQGWLALVLARRGAWDEASTHALAVVDTPGHVEMSRLTALLALAQVRLRRGDPGVAEVLDQALAMAAPSRTLQRIAPTHRVRAEAAFARGDLAAVKAEVDAALPLALAKQHPWFIGELAYWGWRAGALSEPPPGAAEPCVLEMTGHWRDAAAAWQALDCPYEQARALAAGDEAAQRDALAIFERLGARPAAEDLRRRLRIAGVRGVERGARASTREHPAGLTRAEQQVLTLMAQGLRNAEIAARIHRSVRTVDHHVAAVLAKLGVDSRQAAVRHAQRAGWLAADGRAGDDGAGRDAI